MKLGELFITRRDLRRDIDEVQQEVNQVLYYREDQAPTDDAVERYYELRDKLTLLRTELVKIDRVIDLENSVIHDMLLDEHGVPMSLSMARHYKVHLTAVMTALAHQVKTCELYAKRIENDSEIQLVDDKRQSVIVKRKYVIVPEIAELKRQVQELKNQIQKLDSAIQLVDWTVEVEL